MDKRTWLLMATVPVVLLVLLAACARPAPSPTPAPPPSPAAKPSPVKPAPTAAPVAKPAPAPAKTITLKFSAWTQPKGGLADSVNWVLNQIESRSNSRVKFEPYWAGSLIPAESEVEAIGSGVADIAVVFQAFQKRVDLMNVTLLPGMGSTLETQSKDLVEFTKMTAVRDQFDKNNLLLFAIQGGEPQQLWTKTPVKTIADLKGLKIRAVGDQAKVIQALGATPVGLTSAEMYEALSRGTVSGIIITPVGARTWKLEEVSKYNVIIDLASTTTYFIMNKKSWSALPDDMKKVFTEVANEAPASYLRIYGADVNKVYQELLPKAGVEVVQLSAADRAKIIESSRLTWNEWAEKQEKAGLSGKAALAKWLEIRDIK